MEKDNDTVIIETDVIIEGYKKPKQKNLPKESFWDRHCNKCEIKVTLNELNKTIKPDGIGSGLCLKCFEEKYPKIPCPYCKKLFHPVKEKPTSTTGNIIRGAIFLPWGVVSAVKNKYYVECPYCKMKIPQG